MSLYVTWQSPLTLNTLNCQTGACPSNLRWVDRDRALCMHRCLPSPWQLSDLERMLHANCTDQITWPRLHRVTRGAHTLGTSMLCLWRCGSRGCISLLSPINRFIALSWDCIFTLVIILYYFKLSILFYSILVSNFLKCLWFMLWRILHVNCAG